MCLPIKKLPVYACQLSHEDDECAGLKKVRVRKTRKPPTKGTGFVLNDKDVLYIGLNPHIEVRVISQNDAVATVEPVALYVPYLWGIFGEPPRQFEVPIAQLKD